MEYTYIYKTMFQSAMLKTLRETFSTTWNGAKSLPTPDSSSETEGRLALFYKGIRGINDNQLIEYYNKSYKESILDTFLLAFHIRDCRGGKGEREIGRKLLQFLFTENPTDFIKIVSLIPEYGRWDDLLYLFPTVMTSSLFDTKFRRVFDAILSSPIYKIEIQTVIGVICNQLLLDRDNMIQGKPISLCAKWCPSEKDSMDRKYNVVNSICKRLSITPRNYRKFYIGPLRAYLNIVERLMCSKQWSEIDFNKVPSCAMNRLKKAFEKHTPSEFKEWKDNLSTGKTKVNAKVLFPHEIIREVRQKHTGHNDLTLEEAQWKVIEDELAKLGTLSNSLVVVDVSSSMFTPDYLPLDMAISLGLLISNLTTGPFHNNVLTFHDQPTFQVLSDSSLKTRYQQLCKIPWGGNTNLQSTFELILNKAKEFKILPKDMPQKLFIISDMQFNSVESRGYYNKNTMTNYEYINSLYSSSGYTRPQIVFWNVNGSTTDFPVSVLDNGTCLISGASPSAIKAVLYSENMSPYSIFRSSIDNERYNKIRDILKL